MYQGLSIGVVIPAKNEEAAIGAVVNDLVGLKNHDSGKLIDRIVVVDNGSSDKTATIASMAGAEVAEEPLPGYGYACTRGISELDDMDVIVFIDGDHAFFANEVPSLLAPLAAGLDFVVGSRSLGHAAAGALTPHQVFGNKLAVFLIDLLWRYPYTDLGPFRAIKRECLETMTMAQMTYGWTVEMQIKALELNLQIAEVPVNTRVRLGYSKVSGTVSGSIGAGIGIIGTIFKLKFGTRWRNNVCNA